MLSLLIYICVKMKSFLFQLKSMAIGRHGDNGTVARDHADLVLKLVRDPAPILLPATVGVIAQGQTVRPVTAINNPAQVLRNIVWNLPDSKKCENQSAKKKAKPCKQL